jgi:hypothetical protein
MCFNRFRQLAVQGLVDASLGQLTEDRGRLARRPATNLIDSRASTGKRCRVRWSKSGEVHRKPLQIGESAVLERLPLGQAHMMSFELIPIGPLNPLRFLQGMQPKP